MGRLVEPFDVVTVVDTRDYVEEGDRWIPIAGSGDSLECERCGRRHEIHAHVVDVNGASGIVGVGCAVADGPTARRLSSGATRDARRAAKEAATVEATARLEEALVSLPEFPADRVVVAPDDQWGMRWSVDDVKCYGSSDHRHEERVRCLRDAWRRKRLAEAVGGAEEFARLKRLAGPGEWSW